MTEVVQLTEGTSSFITGFTWESNQHTLVVDFKSGNSYKYNDVPKDVFERFLRAKSYGKFLHENLKNKFSGEPIKGLIEESKND